MTRGIRFATLPVVRDESRERPGPHPPHTRYHATAAYAASPPSVVPRLRGMLRNRNLVMPRVWRRYLGAPLQVPRPGAVEGPAPVPSVPQELDSRLEGPRRGLWTGRQADPGRRARSAEALRVRQASVYGQFLGRG